MIAGKQKNKWISQRLDDITNTVSPPYKIPTNQYQDKGKYPIIDQSKSLIAGWTDNKDLLVNGSKPLIIFGDHTCAVKYYDKPFAQGADGVKIIKTDDSILPKYLYYFLIGFPVLPEGYKRHSSKLKRVQVIVPPIEEQKEIVKTISTWDTAIDNIKKQITAHNKQRSGILQKLLGKDLKKCLAVEIKDIGEFHRGQYITKEDLLHKGNNKCIHYGQLNKSFPNHDTTLNTVRNAHTWIYCQTVPHLISLLIAVIAITPQYNARQRCETRFFTLHYWYYNRLMLTSQVN